MEPSNHLFRVSSPKGAERVNACDVILDENDSPTELIFHDNGLGQPVDNVRPGLSSPEG